MAGAPPLGPGGLGSEEGPGEQAAVPADAAGPAGAGPAPAGPAPAGKAAPDPWPAVAAYAGVVVAVFLFLAGLGGGLPWDRSPVGGPGSPAAGGAPVAGAAPSFGAASSAARQGADEPAVPALSPRFPATAGETGPAAPPRSSAGQAPADRRGTGDGSGEGAGAGGSRDPGPAAGPGGEGAPAAGAGSAPAAGGGRTAAGEASDPASRSDARGPGGDGGAEAEPDLWHALAERLWGWRAVLDAMWPGSVPSPPPGAQGAPDGAAGSPAGGRGSATGPLGRRLADLLTEKIAGVRLDEPVTLVASQFPGAHPLEIFEEEGGPVVGRLAPPDVLAGGLPRFRPEAADDGEVAVAGDRPRVLIYHTHTSEAYVGAVPAGTGFDPAVEAFTSDPGASVVGVGTVVQQVLEERGIGTVHLRQVFDRDGERVTRIGNYQRSLAALVGDEDRPGLLDEYPTVDVVLDIHRDGVGREATLTRVGGQPAASILFVVGTDRRLEHPQWHKNYCFVQWLVAELERRHPGLVKGVLVSENRYNQHVRPGAVLVEIGGYGNTPAEAERSARMFGEALAAVIEAGRVPQADRPFQCPPGVKPPG